MVLPPGQTAQDPQADPPLSDGPSKPVRLARYTGFGARVIGIIRRMMVGCYEDGMIHAGNLAYMSMLAIFPFFITAGAIISLIGEEADRAATITAMLTALPPLVGEVIGPVAFDVVEARSGWLLWLGALVGLWTAGSLMETIRDILHRAYGTPPAHAFWKHRLFSTGIILAAVLLLLLSLIAQVMIGAAHEVIEAYFPELTKALAHLQWSRIIPAIGLYASLFGLFVALTPSRYRFRRYPKWPGALLVTLWWIAVMTALPPVLRSVFTYDLTYGSLAGIMIALFFFWLVGLGMVAGAELNAALAQTPEEHRNPMGRVNKNSNGKTAQDDKEDTIA